MILTILDTAQTQGDYSLDLSKDGNYYTVGIYNKKTEDYIKRTFEFHKEALACYTAMIWLLGGYYNDLETKLQEYKF